MARITLNRKRNINGKLNVSRTLDETGEKFIITGALATHLYIEEITSLETPRLKIEGIEVIRENFGSDDYDILYEFKASRFSLKDYMEDGIGYILTDNEIEEIENIMYGDDHEILGGIGKEFKDIKDDLEEEQNE